MQRVEQSRSRPLYVTLMLEAGPQSPQTLSFAGAIAQRASDLKSRPESRLGCSVVLPFQQQHSVPEQHLGLTSTNPMRPAQVQRSVEVHLRFLEVSVIHPDLGYTAQTLGR